MYGRVTSIDLLFFVSVQSPQRVIEQIIFAYSNVDHANACNSNQQILLDANIDWLFSLVWSFWLYVHTKPVIQTLGHMRKWQI